MSGDTVVNLEWRLQHGELPDREHAPRIIIVLCGTNDLRDAKVTRDDSKILRESITAAESIYAAVPGIVTR